MALDTLRRAGVTADAGQTAALGQVDGFVPVWTSGIVTIFAVEPGPGRPSAADLLQPAAEEPLALGLQARPIRQEPEHVAWETAADTDDAAVAAVAYDPACRARVDGEPVAVQRSSDGFVQLDLPPGRTRSSSASPCRGPTRSVRRSRWPASSHSPWPSSPADPAQLLTLVVTGACAPDRSGWAVPLYGLDLTAGLSPRAWLWAPR